MRVQVVFQGGGARVAALLAAAQALRDLESARRLEVTRVAGASAGAIAAVFFASGVDLELVRQGLIEIGDHGLANLFPPRAAWRQFLRAARGKPLYDIGRLRVVLSKFLDPTQRLSDLRIPVLVTVANAGTGAKNTLEDATPVLDAILDSSSLPFVFRTATHLQQNPNLDGGICENLPAEELVREQTGYGPVIAMSFERESQTVPTSPTSLAARVVQLAIDNAVDRATREIGESSVHRIGTPLTTLDFTNVCRDGLAQDPYGRVRSQAREWVENWLEAQHDRQRKVAKEIPLHEYQSRLHSVYLALNTPVDIVRSTMIVVANSMDSVDAADHVYNFRRLRPTHGDLRCFQLSLYSDSANPVDEGIWTVRDDNGNSHNCITLPSKNPDLDSSYRSEILFFAQPLPQGGEYVVERRSMMHDVMAQLKLGQRDFLSHQNTLPQPVLESDLVLVVPNSWTIDDPAFHGVAGQTLSDAILNSTYDRFTRIPGMRAYGWRANNIQQGAKFKVTFEARSS